MAQNHIGHVARSIGNQQLHQRRAAVGDLGGDPTKGYGVQKCFLTGRQIAKKFFHKIVSFHFSPGNQRNYVKNRFFDYTIIMTKFQTFLSAFARKTELSCPELCVRGHREKGDFLLCKTQRAYFVAGS